MPSHRFEALDALRGIAALTIVIYHIRPNWGGYLAVDFFFILSGFVLAHTYLYRTEPISFASFAVRRLARLYPLHLLTLFLLISTFIILERKLPSYDGWAAVTLIQHLTFTQNVGLPPHFLTWNYPSWSVSVELWINVIFFLAVSRKTPSWILILVAAAGLALVLTLTGHLETQALNYFGFLNSGVVRGLSEFLIGVVAYRAFLKLRCAGAPRESFNAFEISSVVCVGLIVLLRSGKVSGLDFLAPLAFVAVIVSFAFNRGVLSRALSRLSCIGTLSYSIYLNQLMVITIFNAFVPLHEDSLTLRICAIVAILVVFSHFTYSYVERPTREIFSSLRRKPDQ